MGELKANEKLTLFFKKMDSFLSDYPSTFLEKWNLNADDIQQIKFQFARTLFKKLRVQEVKTA